MPATNQGVTSAENDKIRQTQYLLPTITTLNDLQRPPTLEQTTFNTLTEIQYQNLKIICSL